MIIEDEIVKWYHLNKRDLPWRNTKEPYEIWISEIILQQTRVDQAMNYYLRFLMEFPDIESLASASEQSVLKAWQGLGYYSRARNLHSSAKYISSELKGKFPDNYAGLIKLKGVGEYTGAAIASFSYQEKIPVLDGNVFRVLSRIYAEPAPINSANGKKKFRDLANELIQTQQPDIFNQAMMEFGALQCVPRNPDCNACPLKSICISYERKMVAEFPVKIKSEKKRIRFFHYFYITLNDSTFIRKRINKDIWQGLYEFPLIETNEDVDFKALTKKDQWNELFGKYELSIGTISGKIIHLLSHQRIVAIFYSINIKADALRNIISAGYEEIPVCQLNNYPVPKLIENYLISSKKNK